MGRIVATEFISLDGVIEDPGGSEDYRHGGWTFEIDRGEEGDKFKLDELMEADAQLLGRVTYEGFAEAWPKYEEEGQLGDFATKMNEMPKYVVSSTLTEPSWRNTTVLDGDPAATVRQLKDEFDGVILIAGSASLVKALIENDLLDELRLMVFPVLLGEGKRIFPEGEAKIPLKLIEAKTVGDGISLVRYERG
ncbi:MAG TPA: dihydrofolate reductase family protein [Solirubrobacterales bacterium]|nr:dihydrofolate reductase family protein [Solirubrobacterales bacterium]